MIRFAKVGAPAQELVRTFTFISNGKGHATLDFTVKYIPPESLNEKVEQEGRRIVGQQRKFNQVEDLKAVQDAQNNYYNTVISSRVEKISGLTPRKLWSLISLDPSQLDAATTNDDITIDVSDNTPITDEDRLANDVPVEVKTYGQQAFQNVLYLINGCVEIRNWLIQILSDVGYFQDPKWEMQLKNSETGASSSSAA